MPSNIDWRRCKQASAPYLVDIIADDTIRRLYPTRLVSAPSSHDRASPHNKFDNLKSPHVIGGIFPRTKKKKKGKKSSTKTKEQRNKYYKCSHCAHKTENEFDYILHRGREHAILVCPWCISSCSFILASQGIALCNKCKKYLKFDDTFNYSNKPRESTTKTKKQRKLYIKDAPIPLIIKRNAKHQAIEIIFSIPPKDALKYRRLHEAGLSIPDDMLTMLGLTKHKKEIFQDQIDKL